jgi:hypothetical protein
VKRQAWLWIGLGVAVVAVAFLAGAPRSGDRVGDPTGTGASGAKALTLLLDHYGAPVTITQTVPADPAITALVIVDDLNEAQRADLRRLAAGGGRVVVADPHNAVAHVTVTDETLDRSVASGTCTIGALDGLGALAVTPTYLQLEPGDNGCFGDRTGAFVVRRPVGAGTITILGSPLVFANDHLDQQDNAALAVALLGGHPIAVIDGPPIGGGDQTLWQLVPRSLKWALLQCVIAFVLVAWWSGRRLGPPASEAVPIDVPAAELVAATGRLWERDHHAEHAAISIRRGFRAELDAAGIASRHLSPDGAAAVTAECTGLPIADLRAALVGPPVADDAELVRLIRLIDHLRGALR